MISSPLQLFLTALVAFNLLPLLPLVPTWVMATASLVLVLKLLQILKGFPSIPKKLIWAIGFAGFVIVFLTKHTLFGEEASTAILFLLATCKLLETDRYRDAMITVVFCFFLLAAYLLAYQSLPATLYFLIDLVLMMQFFLQLHPGNTGLFSFRSVGKILLSILPIWILFFAIFPRFTVAFWHVERETPVSTFADEMNPGEISRLVQTDDLAFRAEIKSAPLSDTRSSRLYWRGAIFTETEGLLWRKKTHANFPTRSSAAPSTESSVEYQIWLEPFFKKWAFTLDYPPRNARLKLTDNIANRKPGFTFEFLREVASRTHYSSIAVAEAPPETLSDEERKINLQLPPLLEPGVSALAQKLSDPHADLAIENLIAWFKANHFYYSLSPGTISAKGSGLETFLFQTHRGFCEHYAAAGAVLLRAMGIPARVVIGFQGGQKNDLGNYWIIKNKNAHAWTEAWAKDRWKRVDLVSAVSPVRLEWGADFFQFTRAETEGADQASALELRRSFLDRLETRSRLVFDALEMQWIRFLVNYDFQFQQNLFSKVGFEGASRLTFFLALIVGLVILIAAISWWLGRPKKAMDPVQRAWEKFCKKMAKLGVLKQSQEGPLDFLNRLLQSSKVLEHYQADVLQEIARIYIQLRYANLNSPKASELNDHADVRLKRLLTLIRNPRSLSKNQTKTEQPSS